MNLAWFFFFVLFLISWGDGPKSMKRQTEKTIRLHPDCLLSVQMNTPVLISGNWGEKRVQIKKWSVLCYVKGLWENQRQLRSQFDGISVVKWTQGCTHRQGAGINYWMIPFFRNIITPLHCLSQCNWKEGPCSLWCDYKRIIREMFYSILEVTLISD